MFTNEELLSIINKGIKNLDIPAKPAGLFDPIRYAMDGGGKRVRPMLTLMAHSLYRDDIETALPAALGIELYHNHTLLHDDLMDKADLRRGKPTVQKKWGENTAVLSGDVMLIMAFGELNKCKSHRLPDLVSLLLKTTTEVCEGQQYDMEFEKRNNVKVDEYLEMIRLKTSVLLACAAQAGAITADAPEADAKAFYDFGIGLGMAFQLRDDYLDAYGNTETFGKATGGDILCGKKTFLLINALNQASDQQRNTLLSLLENTDIEPDEKIAGVMQIYNSLGIEEQCQKAIRKFNLMAEDQINRLSLSADKKERLWNYAESLQDRKS